MSSVPRTLRVAAVQSESLNGRECDNLARAERFVAEAVGRGAELVLCPEFLATGYRYDRAIWRSGEPVGGSTETWLQRLAARHRIHVGASYLEASGEDFYNTFTLAAPSGEVAGRVRKESLPAFEGWFFRGSQGPKVIACELGRIAVGICQDNHTARFLRRICREDADLVLMPHSAPCAPGLLPAGLMQECLSEIAPYYACALGIPIVLANKVHSRATTTIPIAPGVRIAMEFPGLSAVCDGGGRVLGRLGRSEGVVVADVRIAPERKRRPEAPRGYWSREPSRFARSSGLWFRLLERLGQAAYARDPARPLAARAASAR